MDRNRRCGSEQIGHYYRMYSQHLFLQAPKPAYPIPIFMAYWQQAMNYGSELLNMGLM